jgi:hypothetical protein
LDGSGTLRVIYKNLELLRDTIAHHGSAKIPTRSSNSDANFFEYISPKNLRDGFVHRAEWPWYLDCLEALPIAYHILALIIQKNMFEDERMIMKFLHPEQVGCVNDFFD